MARLVHLLHGLLVAVTVTAQKFEGELCEAGPNLFGECMRVESCGSALADIRNGRKPAVCSYEKEMPIVCCANPNIVGSPTQAMPVWPTEDGQRPTQRPQRPPAQTFGGQAQNQRPSNQQPSIVQGQNQRPSIGQGQNERPFGGQGPNQKPFGSQRPNQQPVGGQGPNQQPLGGQRPNQQPFGSQGPTQQPFGGQGPNQQPFGGQRPNQQPSGAQGPNQRPPGVQSQNQQPFGGVDQPPAATAAPSRPPTESPSSDKPTRRPWWQIPNRKTTESPAVIDNLATLPRRSR